MSLSLVKCKILETMLLNEKPAKATEIAKECRSNFKPVMMHLLGLAKMGYIASPSKSLYIITMKGKEALGLPETTIECAKQLLAQTTTEKAFHFYAKMDKPLNLFANSLKDFSEKTQTVDSTSLEFHLCRGDFEKWFISLGDAELAKKMALLKTTGILGEPLRAKLKEILDTRCIALSMLTS
jgi:predicted transcriptional regulator